MSGKHSATTLAVFDLLRRRGPLSAAEVERELRLGAKVAGRLLGKQTLAGRTIRSHGNFRNVPTLYAMADDMDRLMARRALEPVPEPRVRYESEDDEADDWERPDPEAVVAAGVANRTALERAWAAL